MNNLHDWNIIDKQKEYKDLSAPKDSEKQQHDFNGVIKSCLQDRGSIKTKCAQVLTCHRNPNPY